MSVRTPLVSVFELLLADDVRALPSHLAEELSRISASEFDAVVELLAPHRVLPLLSHQLDALDCPMRVGAQVSERLRSVRREVRDLNRLLFLSATLILKAAERAGTEPLVLKGLLFSDSYYPEFDTRPMGDIDLVSAPGESERLHAALVQAGFSRVLDHVPQDHAVAFENRDGVICDAHSYLETYPGAPWSAVSREVCLRRVRGIKVRALEPNVMLAHLIDHMHGHMRDVGFLLLWLIDVALVLRQHRQELDARAFQSAVTSEHTWLLALRIFGLLERHGQTLPEGFLRLKPAIHAALPLSLAAVMRARRTTPWGLPMPKGVLRVLAHRLALRDYPDRVPPLWTDLGLLPLDLLTTRVATRLARLREGRL